MYMYMYMYMDKASFGLASKTALGRTSFGLVDFGMAVDVRRWLGSSKEVGAEIPLIGDMVHVSAVISLSIFGRSGRISSGQHEGWWVEAPGSWWGLPPACLALLCAPQGLSLAVAL